MVYAAALGFGSTSMTLPTADGSSDQALKTNGSGTLSWGSAATSVNGLSDALVEDTGSMYVGNDPSQRRMPQIITWPLYYSFRCYHNGRKYCDRL